MAVLGIFSVKIFYKHNDTYFTNGGFGDYLEQMCVSFDRVILCCKVTKRIPPPGFYPVDHSNLKIVPVPLLVTELGAIALQPVVFVRGIAVVREADVIHARMPDWTGITGSVLARLFGKPCFHQIIGDTAGLARSIPLSKGFGLGAGLRAALLLYDWCERQVSVGRMVFAQGQVAYDKHRRASERFLVLSSAHRAGDMGAVTPRCEGDRLRLLSVGRLQSVKNHQLLIRAIARLREVDPRWELCILGEGPKRPELEALIADLDLGAHVTLPGNLSHGAELWDAYDKADVFALVSVSEGTPKVLLEAMARGCPVVATRVGGIPTAVAHEDRGLLFESGDLDGLVQALTRMAGDKALRERCQNEAWTFSRLNTIEASTRFMIGKVTDRWPHLSPLRRGLG